MTKEELRQYGNSYGEKFRQYEDRIAELEKENAELKDYRLKTLKENQTGIQKYAVNLEHKLSWYDDQLTKAKEIIKELLSYEQIPRDCLKERYRKLLEEAEQFLNSEVEK